MAWYYAKWNDLSHSERLRRWSRYYERYISATLAGQFHRHLEDAADHIESLEERLAMIAAQMETVHPAIDTVRRTLEWQPSCECGEYQGLGYRGIICEICGTMIPMLEEHLERSGDEPRAGNVTQLRQVSG